ncbi:IS66 family insertion sequence element accessory protein TnpB [Enterococcus faecium]|nr:IS66 family insertion sequence element accessory protein TnpB [Enterococcus sp. 079]MCC9080396.1 IS66 family insertion sequence element accessory protein TnpB [Enterococcus faecium]MCC9084866.1 IS66 family insertion sequence element accessory protein TnpB [Enterococcus faecium]
MLYDLLQTKHIYIVCGKTDLRKGIDGLASLIQQEYQLELYEDAVFLFCGNRQDRFKLLYWDGDGFLLCYKRIENGKLKWPRTKDEVRTLTNQQVRWLLEGLSIDQPRAILPGKRSFLSWGLTQKCVEPLFLVRFLWYSVTKSVRFKVVKNFGNYRYVASVASRSP